MSTDLRAWKQLDADQIPPDVTLTVLASDPWTGNTWVGWHDANTGEPCRAMVHEQKLEYAEPHKRKRRVAEV